MLAKILNFVKLYGHDLFVGVCIVLVSAISYNFGQSQALKKTPALVAQNAPIFNTTITAPKVGEHPIVLTPTPPRDPRVVASKGSSSKLYHYSWCSGAKRIKTTNQVWFPTATDAEKAGYTLAGNCTE